MPTELSPLPSPIRSNHFTAATVYASVFPWDALPDLPRHLPVHRPFPLFLLIHVRAQRPNRFESTVRLRFWSTFDYFDRQSLKPREWTRNPSSHAYSSQGKPRPEPPSSNSISQPTYSNREKQTQISSQLPTKLPRGVKTGY